MRDGEDAGGEGIDTAELRAAFVATALGVFLRRIRQREGETFQQMARTLGLTQDREAQAREGQDGADLDGPAKGGMAQQAPPPAGGIRTAHPGRAALEKLAALERGDRIPDPEVERRLIQSYRLTSGERRALDDALFLARDPFLIEGGAGVRRGATDGASAGPPAQSGATPRRAGAGAGAGAARSVELLAGLRRPIRADLEPDLRAATRALFMARATPETAAGGAGAAVDPASEPTFSASAAGLNVNDVSPTRVDDGAVLGRDRLELHGGPNGVTTGAGSPSGPVLRAARPIGSLSTRSTLQSPLNRARAQARALRAALLDARGRVPAAALTDGLELLLDRPIRLIFCDAADSEALFGAAPPEILAFSGEAETVSPLGEARASGEDMGAMADDGGPSDDRDKSDDQRRGGYVCLRHGVLERLCDDDPAARFALLHEIGHRLETGLQPAGGPSETPAFDARTLRSAGAFVTPDLPQRDAPAERQSAAIGPAPPHAEGPAPAASGEPRAVARALAREAAANVFAFCVLTAPERFQPAVQRLDQWAAQHGAPFAAALAFQRRCPEIFRGAPLSAGRPQRGFLGLRDITGG
ncbi:MAG: hypothetical protein AAF909_00300 [Pseudomonadota bacterium]